MITCGELRSSLVLGFEGPIGGVAKRPPYWDCRGHNPYQDSNLMEGPLCTATIREPLPGKGTPSSLVERPTSHSLQSKGKSGATCFSKTPNGQLA